jgi:predicted PurR-regulated permease PerM
MAPPVPTWVRTVSTVSWAFVGGVLAVGLVVVGLGAVREVVIPVVLSGFLAVVFSPAVGWLAQRRVPRAVGALAILVLITVVVSAAIGAVVVGIVDQQENLRARFADVVSRVEDLLEQSALTEVVERVLNGAQGSGSFLRDGLGSTVGSAIGTAGGFVSGIVLAAVVLYYLLKDGPKLVETTSRKLSGDGDGDGRLDRILLDAAGSIRAYMKGRTILALVQGAAMGIVAAVAGVPLAFTVGVVNFLGAYVPYIGGFIGGAFAVLMAVSVGGIGLAAIMLVAAIGISVGLENLLEPALLGTTLALHPIVVLFATVTGGLLVGVVGMILAAPLVAIGRMLFRELADSGFFASDSTTENGRG